MAPIPSFPRDEPQEKTMVLSTNPSPTTPSSSTITDLNPRANPSFILHATVQKWHTRQNDERDLQSLRRKSLFTGERFKKSDPIWLFTSQLMSLEILIDDLVMMR